MNINQRSAFPRQKQGGGEISGHLPRPGCPLLRYPSSRPTRCRLPQEGLYISSIRIHQLVYRRAPIRGAHCCGMGMGHYTASHRTVALIITALCSN